MLREQRDEVEDGGRERERQERKVSWPVLIRGRVMRISFEDKKRQDRADGVFYMLKNEL